MIEYLFRKIRNIVLIGILLIAGMAGLDYYLVTKGEKPIFVKSYYDESHKKQYYNGIVHQIIRDVYSSPSEPIENSKKLTYELFSFPFDIPITSYKSTFDYTIETKETDNCTNNSILYYADKDIKIYTVCLDKIEIKENNKSTELKDYNQKNKNIVNTITNDLGYRGLYVDDTTRIFKDRNNNFTNNGLTVYQCNTVNIGDYYIGPKDLAFQNDFCTYKEDDFIYLFEIAEDIPTDAQILEEKETFYEDAEYLYQFDTTKSNFVYLITPEVRGRNATSITLKEALQNNMVTIDILESKGLKFEKVKKEENN